MIVVREHVSLRRDPHCVESGGPSAIELTRRAPGAGLCLSSAVCFFRSFAFGSPGACGITPVPRANELK
jgi:hypothetical protein